MASSHVPFNETDAEVPAGTIHRTIALLEGALRGLDAGLDTHRVEEIGVMVNRAMSVQERSFHTPEHIFDLANPNDPHTTLAALFHDIVYYHVDRGFSDAIGALLKPYISIEPDGVRLRTDVPTDDRAFHGCCAVFGCSPGEILSPFGGLNEFLSALVMDVLLVGVVSDRDLLIATANIEATIPFRRPDDRGRRPAEILAERLAETNTAFAMGLSDEQIRNVVVASVVFANRDVRNFAEDDVARFLDNTWKLLPESNPELRLGGLYTVRSYATALKKMHGFLSFLQPGMVFSRFDGVPEKQEYTRLVDLAARNIAIGRRYLGIKLMSSGILHALAQLTGGDAPMAYFMGDLNPQGDRSTLSAFLPDRPDECGRSQDENDDLYRLLAHGRTAQSRFDLSHSPLSLFVYRCLSDEQLDRAVHAAYKMFDGDLSPEAFLETMPRLTVADIAEAARHMAFTRADELGVLAARYRD